MISVQEIDQLLYENVSMKKQILIAFTAMNIWHSVKSFDISILTSQRLYNVQTKLSKRMPRRQSWILFTVFAIFSHAKSRLLSSFGLSRNAPNSIAETSHDTAERRPRKRLPYTL